MGVGRACQGCWWIWYSGIGRNWRRSWLTDRDGGGDVGEPTNSGNDTHNDVLLGASGARFGWRQLPPASQDGSESISHPPWSLEPGWQSRRTFLMLFR